MGISGISNITGYGQIASGKRINRAADDAAGMAIANKLEVSTRGTQAATQNTREGILATMEIASNPTGKGSSIKMYSATLEKLGLDGYSVLEGEINLDAINKAIEKVSSDRSKLGASANGLEARERENQVAYENMTAAQSRIEDLDMGKAVSELRKEETLQEVKIAMLNKKKEQEQNILGLF